MSQIRPARPLADPSYGALQLARLSGASRAPFRVCPRGTQPSIPTRGPSRGPLTRPTEVSAPSSSFETTYLGSTGTVAVLGDVDIANAPEFGAAVDAVIERGVRLVVLDLSGTAFMDAAGLSVIATRAVLLAHLDGPLTVRSPSPLLARIISVTRLNAVTNVELRDI